MAQLTVKNEIATNSPHELLTAITERVAAMDQAELEMTRRNSPRGGGGAGAQQRAARRSAIQDVARFLSTITIVPPNGS